MQFILKSLVGFVLILSSTTQAGDTITGDFSLSANPDGSWTASYKLDEPVAAINFNRNYGIYQKDYWSFGDGFLLAPVEEDGFKYGKLIRADGKAIQEFSIHIGQYTGFPEKDYMAFSTFTGGGVSIYTGYFTGNAVVGGKTKELQLHASYMPPEGYSVITKNREYLVGQFVYMGPEAYTSTTGAAFIADKALPSFIVETLQTGMPKVDAALSNLFSYSPKQAYQVFLAGGELLSKNGAHSKGGALNGQALFTFKGRQYVDYYAKNPEDFLVFVAHETIHLWQHDLWPNLSDDDNAWIHEGMADALAISLLYDQKLITNATYQGLVNKKQKACVKGLAKTSVNEASSKGQFQVHYDCGATLHWAIGDLMTRLGHENGFLKVWKTMAAVSEVERSREGKELLFGVLLELGANETDIAAIELFLNAEASSLEADPVAILHKNLSRKRDSHLLVTKVAS